MNTTEEQKIRPEASDPEADTAISLDPPENRTATLERKERLLAKIQSANTKTRELESIFLAAKAEAKSAKDMWETSVLALQRLIESAHNGQLLLPGIDQEAPQVAPELSQDAEAQKDAGENPDASDELWRDVSMESVGVRGKLLERLIEWGVSTLGDWTDWHGQGQNRTKIYGIGEGAIAKVADLCEAFWRARREQP